jgi:hypothetical protein
MGEVCVHCTRADYVDNILCVGNLLCTEDFGECDITHVGLPVDSVVVEARVFSGINKSNNLCAVDVSCDLLVGEEHRVVV